MLQFFRADVAAAVGAFALLRRGALFWRAGPACPRHEILTPLSRKKNLLDRMAASLDEPLPATATATS